MCLCIYIFVVEMTDSEVKELFTHMDVNPDGAIDHREFMLAFQSQEEGGLNKKLHEDHSTREAKKSQYMREGGKKNAIQNMRKFLEGKLQHRYGEPED